MLFFGFIFLELFFCSRLCRFGWKFKFFIWGDFNFSGWDSEEYFWVCCVGYNRFEFRYFLVWWCVVEFLKLLSDYSIWEFFNLFCFNDVFFDV